jgi:hypothetical protein
MSEYIVATTLRPYVQPFALQAVERVVQMRSRIESLGNVNLIDAVRVHITPDSVGLLQPATSTNPRKFQLQSVHKEVSVRSVEQTVAV